MEAAEELASGSKEQTHIVKGKRTKRVRPQSPIPLSITGNSPNHGHGEAQDDSNNGDEDDKSSPATTTRHRHSTEEEEDMANCLILLAQGQSRESPKPAVGDDGMNYTKYSSRRFMEAASLGSGKAGFYVYECRTCNRTFPSFQALGGHRTSHKKPKAMEAFTAANDNEKKQLLFMSNEDEFQLKNNNSGNPFSLQLNRGNLCSNNSNKPKVHECSLCGAEFTSGQALGGHMRRHRTPIGTNTMLSLIPMALEPEEQQQPRKRRNVLSLDLDLNLPAPEDDQTESKFSFASKQQEQHKQQQKQHQQHQANLVFTAPALVGCHY